MEATGIYFLARLCTCGVWAASAVHEVFHYKHTTAKMTQNHVPWAKYVLVLVIIMKFGGSLMLITNQFVWAASLAWILFMIPATFLYHFTFYEKDGRFIFPQMIQFSKNVSILGGLLALILLDPDKPQWLVALIHKI